MILVTGATGTVGRYVIAELCTSGAEVIGATTANCTGTEFPDGVACRTLIFDRPDTYHNAFEGVRKLFLMRPPQISDVSGVIAPRFYLQRRRRGTPRSYAMIMTALYTATRFGSGSRVSDDIERISGKKPNTLRQYVRDFAHTWMR